MKVSLLSQAQAVQACLDRFAVIARDRGLKSDAAMLFRQQLQAALETIREKDAETRGKR